MKEFLIHWVVDILSFVIIDALFSSVSFADAKQIAILALVLALINVTLKPILKVLSIPINIMTLGLFSLVINALMLLLAFNLTSGAYIRNFGTAFWVSIVFGIINSLLSSMIFKENSKRRRR